jgi:2-keto-3-deoxy-L-rhamnonate aldolase RhmA
VQVPHVNTAEDAHEVIAAVKYHPAGRRGLAAGTRAALYDSHGTLADHVKAADEATLIAIQLEDQLAIDNIDEPLEIEDVDVFFIGPADLSQSMGYPRNPKAPAVAQAIERSFRKMVSARRTPGTPAVAEKCS